MDAITALLPTAAGVLVLTGIATAVLLGNRISGAWSVVVAIVRAILQLTLLSLILTGVISSPLLVGIALGVMLVAAVGTSGVRTRAGGRQLIGLALAMGTGSLVVLAVVFLTGAIEFSPRYVLAIGGIVIGNTMTIASLSSRVFTTSISDHWDEVEGWLALGARPVEATRRLARAAVLTALIPSIDQTKTTGIVVLPGAFVGAIFAGATPLEAGRFQIVVLASILAAGAITSTLLVRIVGTGARLPVKVH
jgi:putative ABC transport system permease protein